MTAPRSARAHIEALRLRPHPEGGHFRELYRDPAQGLHPITGETRSWVTCIYFLLERGTFSALHRVAQTEIWHHLDGGPLTIVTLTEAGARCDRTLGKDIEAGEEPQLVVPAGVWQAATPTQDWALMGCTVAPGFDFADFELPPRSTLLAKFPAHAALIVQLTR